MSLGTVLAVFRVNLHETENKPFTLFFNIFTMTFENKCEISEDDAFKTSARIMLGYPPFSLIYAKRRGGG